MEIEKAYQEKEKNEQEQKDAEELQTKKEVEEFYAHIEETEPQLPPQEKTEPTMPKTAEPRVPKTEPERPQPIRTEPIKPGTNLVGIICEIKNGNAIYSIISDGMEPIEEKADPYKMTKNNKQDLSKDIDPYYFSNSDIGIVRILKKIDYQHGTKFYDQYLDNVKYMEDEGKSNIQIKYDLMNLRNTDLN